VAALKELGLQAAVTVPEPNTWREVVSTLEFAVDLLGKRVAIQEYGIANPELVAALASRGAAVIAIPIYRWALPEDIAPLRAAIDKIIRGEAEIVLFTNGAQVDHLFQIAESDNANERLRAAIKNLVIGSVGPVCTDVLRQFGLQPDIEPVHPKMGSLIAEVAARANAVLFAKKTL
jgi:uroporphyrinogen-III synthase